MLKLRESILRVVYTRIIHFLRRGLDNAVADQVGVDPAKEAQELFERRVPYRSASGDLKDRGFDRSGLNGIFDQRQERQGIHDHGVRGGATAQGQY